MSTVCAVPLCPALVVVKDSMYCTVHDGMSITDLVGWLSVRQVGMVAPLMPVTDRIDYDEDGRAIRFYPETRR